MMKPWPFICIVDIIDVYLGKGCIPGNGVTGAYPPKSASGSRRVTLHASRAARSSERGMSCRFEQLHLPGRATAARSRRPTGCQGSEATSAPLWHPRPRRRARACTTHSARCKSPGARIPDASEQPK